VSEVYTFTCIPSVVGRCGRCDWTWWMRKDGLPTIVNMQIVYATVFAFSESIDSTLCLKKT